MLWKYVLCTSSVGFEPLGITSRRRTLNLAIASIIHVPHSKETSTSLGDVRTVKNFTLGLVHDVVDRILSTGEILVYCLERC